MPNKVRRNSVVDMLAKVPVNRGSLLTSIDNLLKTIESSESAVMIPTLLRDKCEFDAWELLFVAKILKASILGHSDLVEFYMNHIHTSSQFAQQAAEQQQNSLSPSMARRASPVSSPSGLADSNGVASGTGGPLSAQTNGHLPTSPSLSSNGSISSVTTATTTSSSGSVGGSAGISQSQLQQATQQPASRGQSTSASWTTANQAASSNGSTSAASLSSLANGNCPTGEVLAGSASEFQEVPSQPLQQQQQQQQSANQVEAESLSLSVGRPQIARQAQPPSLLQLTTTNNHINSVANAHSFTNNNIEQLTNQLTAMQVNGCLSGAGGVSQYNGIGGGSTIDGALSISTTTANQQSAATSGGHTSGATTHGPATPTSVAHPHELRTSRSAGCLFRINSGASSPRTPAQTPTTPYPQAETLAGVQANPFAGCDPSTPVKLLLQIEQLKSSIKHVTSLLDSVVELYKKSIDNIALA